METLYRRVIDRAALAEVRRCSLAMRDADSSRERLRLSIQMREAAGRVQRFFPVKAKP